MSSSQLDSFNRSWKERWASMSDHHYDERMRLKAETDAMKKSIMDNARARLEDLPSRVTPGEDFFDEARKIREHRDATLKSIDKEYNERMSVMKRLQEKEQARHEQAHNEAIADRLLMNSTSPTYSTATTTTMTTEGTDTGAANNGGTALTSRTPANWPPGPSRERTLPSRDSTPATTASREQDQSAVLRKGFSCTVQRLQEAPDFRAKPSSRIEGPVDHPPTPISTTSAADYEIKVPRTVTFEEVYQNGQAKHKDTIIEFPPDSCQWYIIKCEEHGVRFNQRPLQGAAKHLNGRQHDWLDKNWSLAVKVLGYRVIDCNEELAAVNNKAVKEAFAMGYKPENRKLNQKPKPKPQPVTGLMKGASEKASHKTDAIRKRHIATARAHVHSESSSPSSPRRCRASPKKSGEIITNPKTFHIYYCLWERRRYPVMILGWDDQKPGGLDLDLIDTGLLAKESNPPKCYTYKNDAIVDWAPKFQDGGSKVNKRKFPAMFFDDGKRVGWISASWLSKFPLFSPNAPKKESHPFNVARRWIAKNEGFTSWEEFEAARKEPVKETTGSSVIAPSVSSQSDADDSGSGSDAEGSARSSTSNVTQKELQELQAKAGEIAGDSDYSASEMDSTLGDECDDEWDKVEPDGRPWAFYDLRNKAHDGAEKAGPSSPRRSSGPTDTEAVSPIREGMREARRLSEHACTREISDSAEEGSSLETSSRDEALKKTIQNPTRSRGDKVTSSVGVTTSIPLRESALRAHTAQTDAETEPLGALKGLKRARSKEPSEENAKKPKLGINIPSNQVDVPIISEPLATPVESFKPKTPLGPAAFELSFYSKGRISWDREGESEGSSIKLYYGESNGMVGSIDGPVDVVIDPANLTTLAQENIPESRGNVRMTLLSKNSSEAPVRLVFNRANGSKLDIGKLQARNFIRWLKGVNGKIRILEHERNNIR
ncbi:hypothetical protein F5Y10DRAFT_177194 [Nemania abortiva]|nr:hypothetical protein F5Y10DRAFT_177194 [Nemania abortiva]